MSSHPTVILKAETTWPFHVTVPGTQYVCGANKHIYTCTHLLRVCVCVRGDNSCVSHSQFVFLAKCAMCTRLKGFEDEAPWRM